LQQNLNKKLSTLIADEDKILGHGAFGMVVEGTVKGKPVAVKMLLPGSEKHYLKSLVSELKLLSFLGEHEHIASLVGAYTSQLKYRKNYEFYILQLKIFSAISRYTYIYFFLFRQTLHFS